MKRPRQRLKITVKITGKHIPKYQSSFAAGCDLFADIKRPIKIRAGTYCRVPTGIAIEIPSGYEAQVRPRSGLAYNNGIGVLNSPGTIDADYRGEIKVILFNFSKQDLTICPADRIAQLVFSPVTQARFKKVKKLKTTARGSGGFGHTGMKRTQNEARLTLNAKRRRVRVKK